MVPSTSSGAPAGAARPSPRRRVARRILVACAGLSAALGLAFALAWFLSPYPAERLDAYPAGMRILDRAGGLVRVFPSSRGEFRLPVCLDEMSPWLAAATVAVEDRRFRDHPGVDPLAIARAVGQNIHRLRVHSGASTLTQQLVRMLDERPRTLRSKAIEAFRALQLETQRTKDQLLEAYLNLAPYGGNLRGVEAAALRYFGKGAKDLTLSESALIAGLPQAPSRLRPDRHYERALARRRLVLESMLRCGSIDERQFQDALLDRPHVAAHPWPFEAPHFAEMARARSGGVPAVAGCAVRTTLDPGTQALAEMRLDEAFAADRRGRARLGGAVVVLEASTGAVRALVGSPDYFSGPRKGGVNACLQIRSPGSALKPFLYAQAFNLGIATPESLLLDTPLSYATHVPENFDRRFRGPVRAGDALSLSLNVPAARLQTAVGTPRFLDLLRGLELRTLDRAPGDYGLSLALGGCEVTLIDLAAAYACLLRLGTPVRWRVLDEHVPGGGPPLLSPGACRLVLEILSSESHLRRALPDRPPEGQPFLGYKTGTSYGNRDAWAVAFTSTHVVAVWIGDPRGGPQHGLVGADVALPVALSVAGGVARVGDTAVPGEASLGDIVGRRPVCTVTGLPAGRVCPRVQEGRYPRGAPAPPTCDVHREIRVDRSTGLEVCTGCAAGRFVDRRILEVWPNELGLWFATQGVRAGEELPPHEPSCTVAIRAGRPRILSPAAGAQFLLREGPAPETILAFSAAASSGVSRLFWIVNGEPLSVASPRTPVLWKLRRGDHEIRCIDERGRADVVRFRVR